MKEIIRKNHHNVRLIIHQFDVGKKSYSHTLNLVLVCVNYPHPHSYCDWSWNSFPLKNPNV